MQKLVRSSYDEKPQLTAAARRRLKRLAQRPDSEIDYSDIPPLPANFGKRALQRSVRNPFSPAGARGRKQMAVTLDADVFAWLNDMGTQAQRKLNSVLRAAMKSSRSA